MKTCPNCKHTNFEFGCITDPDDNCPCGCHGVYED